MKKTTLLWIVLLGLALPLVTASGFTSEGGVLKWNGKRFYLKGASWFGFETPNNMMHGTWARDYHALLDFLVQNKFNAMRVPWYLELGLNDGKPDSILSYCPGDRDPATDCNKELIGQTSMGALEEIIKEADKRGILVMLDMHSFKGGTFMADGMWYDATHNEAMTIKAWLKMAERFSKYPNVFAADIKNEPHLCTWGKSAPDTDFNGACERIGNALLEKTDWLIFCEGVAGKGPTCTDTCFWGENLQGVKEFPVVLSKPNKIVYSPHVYGPCVYPQDYFLVSDFPKNMPKIWETHFAYVRGLNQSAVVIGEWGGKFEDKPTNTWIRALVDYLISIDMTDQFFWCLNPDSGDTGGLLQDDWKTPQKEKLDLLAKLVPSPSVYQSGPITPVNECATTNGGCDSSAQCKDEDVGFSCVCAAGLTLTNGKCEKPTTPTVNACATTNGGCDSTNGLCQLSGTSVVCSCKSGYALNTDGKSCKQNTTNPPTPTACSSSPCGAQGTCSETGTATVAAYKCTCKNNYTGVRCTVAPTTPPPSTNDCSSSPCGLGTCTAITGGGYSCECPTDQIEANGGCQDKGVNPCAGNPCAPGGTCTVISDTERRCACKAGYSSKNGACVEQASTTCNPVCVSPQTCINGKCATPAVDTEATPSGSSSTLIIVVVVLAVLIVVGLVVYFVFMRSSNKPPLPTATNSTQPYPQQQQQQGFFGRFSRGGGFQKMDDTSAPSQTPYRPPAPPARPTGQSIAINGAWETYQTPQGATYYYNRITQQTTWNKPF